MQVHAVTVRHVVVVHISLEELRRVPPVTGDRSAGTALPGGPYSPTTSSIFSAACGSVVNLNVVTRSAERVRLPDPMHGCVGHPRPAGHSRVVQWVTPGAGARSVRATTCARCRAVSVGGRPARGRSCRPATPPSANRRRRRLTWTTLYPVRLATSTPDSPAAISSTARTRRLSPARTDGDRCSRSNSCQSASRSSVPEAPSPQQPKRGVTQFLAQAIPDRVAMGRIRAYELWLS